MTDQATFYTAERTPHIKDLSLLCQEFLSRRSLPIIPLGISH